MDSEMYASLYASARCDGCICVHPCEKAIESIKRDTMNYGVTDCTPDKLRKTVELLKQRPGKHECIEAKTIPGGYCYYVYRVLNGNRNIIGYEMIVVRPKSD